MPYKKLVKPMLLLLLLGALVIYFVFSPYEYDMLPCPIYKYTGLHCAGCGTQRALHHFLHLEFILGLRNNLLLPVWVFLGLDYLYAQYLKKEGKALVLQPWMPKVVFVILVLFLSIRNIPQYPFNLLAPIWE